jgi:hypothetical protein
MTSLVTLSTHQPDEKRSLGTLSIHLDGVPCTVGCPFCYLGARTDGSTALDAGAPPGPQSLSLGAPGARLDPRLVSEALAQLRYDEVAVALSEPLGPARPLLATIVAAARAPVAVTTTLSVAARAPEVFDGVARANLSVDPAKGPVEVARIAVAAAALEARHPQLEIVLIASLASPAFAARLVDDGLLAELVDLPAVDKVALNALKPPPDWCDRAFWMRALHRLSPLLERALDRRLFLDCYVAARLLRLGGCPARADLSPAVGGVAFRGCVYQAAPDFVSDDAAAMAARLERFVAPAVCPFPIR